MVREGFGITAPKGFFAGAVCCGIKKSGGLDLGILFSSRLCSAAGLFTANKFKAAPIILSRRKLREGIAQAVVVNSGNANAGTGTQGLEDAKEISRLVAKKLVIHPNHVIVASTGIIGFPLPMERIKEGIKRIELSPNGGEGFAKAIMTTDTRPKQGAVFCSGYTIGGVAKGAGMIHPQLGTMLAFITTDAKINHDFLKRVLKRATDLSFNMITIDGQISPNDMVVILANGLSGREIWEGEEEGEEFEDALTELCVFLAKSIVMDGEGARRVIEVLVERASDLHQARKAARAIAGSILVKTAIYGSSPNWGRILVALGQSGARFDPKRTDLYLEDICLMRGGKPLPLPEKSHLFPNVVKIRVNLNVGGYSATAWGCDLTPEYVAINSTYLT